MKKIIFLEIAILTGLISPVSYSTFTEIYDEDQNINKSLDIGQLFKVHQLPKDITELGQATKAHLLACKMLEQGQGVKALPYLCEAERFYIPEALTVLWDISQGRYSKIPKHVQLEIENHFQGTQNYQKLEAFYQKVSSKNHQDLIKKSHKSTLSCAFEYISQNYFSHQQTDKKSKISQDHISFEQSLKNQKVSISDHEIDLVTSQENVNLLKKIR